MKKRALFYRIKAGTIWDFDSVEKAKQIISETGSAARLDGCRVVFVRDFLVPMSDHRNSSASTRRNVQGRSASSVTSLRHRSGQSSLDKKSYPDFDGESPGEELGV